jgi:hypothetical protein
MNGILGRGAGFSQHRAGEFVRQALAIVLSALMIMVPMSQQAVAQDLSTPPPPQMPQDQPPAGTNQPPAAEPLSNEQLEQLVAPIALYPDPLVAQVLAAATYPTQVVEADRWRQSMGNATPEQIGAGADAQNWDPSVKALTAFPAVLAQMDRNLQWTTDLGNAYYNQPQDVMDAVQRMRQRAQAAGQLRSTPQQTVQNDNGAVTIQPANPTVVYVPTYDPWVVYGAPVVVYPGYYYAPAPGVFWGGLAIGFGIGIAIGFWGHWGWGWGHWGVGWGPHWGGWHGYRGVVYNHTTYVTRSTTVINRGVNRAGSPPRSYAGTRGSYAVRGASYNRSTAYHGSTGVSRTNTAARSSASYNRPASGNYARPNVSRPGATANRAAASGGRPSFGGGRPGSVHPSGGGHSTGGGHAGGGGHASGGGGGHHGK